MVVQTLQDKGKSQIEEGVLNQLSFDFLKKSKCVFEFKTRDQLKRHLRMKHLDSEIHVLGQKILEKCPKQYLLNKLKNKTSFSKKTINMREINELTNTYQSLNNELANINKMVNGHGHTMKRIEENNYFSQTHPTIFKVNELQNFQIQNTAHEMNFIPKKNKKIMKVLQPLQLVDTNTQELKPFKKQSMKRMSKEEKENKICLTPNSMSLKINNIDADLRGLLTEGKELKQLVEKEENDEDENISANLSFQTNNGLISARDPFEDVEDEEDKKGKYTKNEQVQENKDIEVGIDSGTLEEINVNLDILNQQDSFSGKKDSQEQKTNSNLFKEIEEDFETENIQESFQRNLKKEGDFSNKKRDCGLGSLNEIQSEFFVDKSNAEKKIFETLHSHLRKGLDSKIEKKQAHITNLKKDLNTEFETRNKSIYLLDDDTLNEVDISLLSFSKEQEMLNESLTHLENMLKKTKNLNIKKKNLLKEEFIKNNHLYNSTFDLNKII